MPRRSSRDPSDRPTSTPSRTDNGRFRLSSSRANLERPVSIVVAVLVLVGVGGFLVIRARQRQAAETNISSADLAPVTAPSARRTRSSTITLAFGGDVHLEGEARTVFLADSAALLAGVAAQMNDADFAMANLDTAVADDAQGADEVVAAWRAPRSIFALLGDSGVDAVTMANSHSLDAGRRALVDAVATSRSQRVPVVGAGNDDAEAYTPLRVTVKGQRLAVFAAIQASAAGGDTSSAAGPGRPGLASASPPDRLVTEVRTVRPTADIVVVYLTWGEQESDCPSVGQRELARQLVSAGADVVVGSGAHRLQGAGRLDTGFVGYGLGNLVFWDRDPQAAASGVLRVTLTGRRVSRYELRPFVVRAGVPASMSATDAERAVGRWAPLRGCAQLLP